MIWQCYPEIIHVEDVEVNVKGNGETIHLGMPAAPETVKLPFWSLEMTENAAYP